MFTSRKPSAALLAAGTLLGAFGLAGCSNNPPQTPPTVVNTSPPPAATTTTATPGGTTTTTTANGAPATKINVNAGPGSSQGTDQAAGEAVNKAIVTNKQMTGARVEAVVTAGVATLTGSVQDRQQKALAEKAARDTPGVTSVKNKLQVNPTGGAKSAAKPPTTKVIVVHKTVTAAPQPPSPPQPPAVPGGNAANNGTNSMSSGSPAKSKSDNAAPNSSAPGAPNSSAPGAPAPGSGQ